MHTTENELDEWVRSHAGEAQGVVVELIWRLVAASCPRPKERRFPLGDSVNQDGPDGYLNTDDGFEPFVPAGTSYWEIGTGIKAGSKATDDYKARTGATPMVERQTSAFVFVTPLSGRRDWDFSWKESSQLDWQQNRRDSHEWQDVRVIDGTRVIDWLRHFPAVDQWLAGRIMGSPVSELQTPEERWHELERTGQPPLLIPEVFLANRDAARERLNQFFSGKIAELRLETRYRGQIADFVGAHVATMDGEARADAAGRCLLVLDADAWNLVIAMRKPHLLVAVFDLADAGPEAVRLLERARQRGHAIAYEAAPGGLPHPCCETLQNPKSYQIEEALKKATYNEERARSLAQRSNGNLTYLLRCLHNLSLSPAWSQGTAAADLAIAELLGCWDEDSESDRNVGEKLSKKAYGEWIGTLRNVANGPDAPLTYRNKLWRFAARYEGWYALGPRLFDEHLERLREVAVEALREKDPKFELPQEERFAASVHGKVLPHSPLLRKGLAETLALLGAHPAALTSCSSGRAEATAAVAVREILTDADWVLWASLNSVLPLLAEAAPGEFLASVETALRADPCPFDAIFAEEGSGITGGNYMTGLLWALESIAWDAEYLTHVVVMLGKLAARDPGGSWGNRPANSLSTILLPWLPQTCANLAKRKLAVTELLRECLAVAWKLLLALLPTNYGASHGSYKPSWRTTIPDDWTAGVTRREHRDQVIAYAELAVSVATGDPAKLTELVDRLDDLPPAARDQVLAHLETEGVASMSERDRLPLWIKLNDLVSKHRRFPDANWGIAPGRLADIAAIADHISPQSPFYRHQTLFAGRDFGRFDEITDVNEHLVTIAERRRDAVKDIFASGSTKEVIEFARAVAAPWEVGFALALFAADDVEKQILPDLLESEEKQLSQFVGGFVGGRFHSRHWGWVDGIETSQWSPSQKGQFLAYLPFTIETWERCTRLLRDDESAYWSRANVNPYVAKDGLDNAIDALVRYGRPHEAVGCLAYLRFSKRPVDSERAVRALLEAVRTPGETGRAIDAHATVQVIEGLQADPSADPNKVMAVEWAYLPLLDKQTGASPRLLEQLLADDPNFFCELIRLLFRSQNEEQRVKEQTEQQKYAARNGYRLLSGWDKPPGTRRDNTFDSGAFAAWLKLVKSACAESGHLGVGISHVGNVLAHSPPDPDGLWLHRSIAVALNADDAEDMRRGFANELYNSRGVHWVDPTGKPERDLAQKYRAQAREVDDAGFYRLAGCLREFADVYDREAEQIVADETFGD